MFESPWIPRIVFEGEEGGGQGGGAGEGQQQTPPAAGGGNGGGSGSRAEERIADAISKQRDAEARAKDAEEKLKQREDADLSEIDKAKKAAEREKARADAAESKVTRMERQRFAETAATAAGFRRTEDAVLRLNLDELADEAAIETAVKALAEREDLKDLIREGDEPTRPPAFGHLGGGSPAPRGGEVPKGEDGKDDVKLGLGQEILQSLTGRK